MISEKKKKPLFPWQHIFQLQLFVMQSTSVLQLTICIWQRSLLEHTLSVALSWYTWPSLELIPLKSWELLKTLWPLTKANYTHKIALIFHLIKSNIFQPPGLSGENSLPLPDFLPWFYIVCAFSWATRTSGSLLLPSGSMKWTDKGRGDLWNCPAGWFGFLRCCF